MPHPRGRPAHNKGSYWSEDSLKTALEEMQTGWSIPVALSRAGHSSHIIVTTPFRNHPIYKEMLSLREARDDSKGTRSVYSS